MECSPVLTPDSRGRRRYTAPLIVVSALLVVRIRRAARRVLE